MASAVPLDAPSITVVPHVTMDAVPPPVPARGDFWYNTSNGFLFIWYDDGNTIQWVVANPGRGSLGPPGPPGPPGTGAIDLTIVPTNADLVALSNRPTTVHTLGFQTPGDGGAGEWRWVPGATHPANDGVWLEPAGLPAGRYRRNFTGGVKARWFGCGLNLGQPSVFNNPTYDNTQFQKAVDHGLPIDISDSTIPLSNITVGPGDSPSIFSDGSGALTCDTTTTYQSRVVSVTNDDFHLDNIQLKGPISTDPGASFTGSVSGNTLTITGTVVGTINIGALVVGFTTFLGNAYIVSGGGLSWQLSGLPQTVASQAMKAGIYPACQTMLFPSAQRLKVTRCLFQGATIGIYGAIYDGTSLTDCLVDGCTFQNIYHEALALNGGQNIIITNNQFHDGGYDVTGTGAAGCTRIGVSDNANTINNVTLSGNVIARWNVGLTQEGMDFFAGSIRNLNISDNVIDGCGNGGMELKTNNAVPAGIYQDWLIANNFIYLQSTRGSGISLNNASDLPGPHTPVGKHAHIKITGNYIMAPAGSTGTTGIGITGWDDVEVDTNKISSVVTGISVTPSVNVPVINGLDIHNNSIFVSGSGIIGANGGSTINNMRLRNNRVVVTGASHAVYLPGDTVNNLVMQGNYFETTGTGVALDLVNIQGGYVEHNILKAASNSECVYLSGNDNPGSGPLLASANLRLIGNDILALGASSSGVRIDSGTGILFDSNTVQCSASGEGIWAPISSYTVTGGTYNSTTGLVTLTTSVAINFAPGRPITVVGAGTGANISAISGNFTTVAPTSGTSVSYTIATGLAIATITGTSVVAPNTAVFTALNTRRGTRSTSPAGLQAGGLGDVFNNMTPAIGAPEYWLCVVAGTPSTAVWQAMGGSTSAALPTTSAGMRALITDETGTGAMVFQSGALGAATATSLVLNDGAIATPSLNFVDAPLSGLYRDLTGGPNGVGIAANGKPALVVLESGVAGTYVGVSSNNTPTIVAAGITNIALQLAGTGTGGVDLMTAGAAAYVGRFTGPGANYPVFTSTATGTGPLIQPAGVTDTNIDLRLQALGTGFVKTLSALQVPAGTALLPSFNFANATTTGLAAISGSTMSLIVAAKEVVRINGSSASNYIALGASSVPTVAAAGLAGAVGLILQSQTGGGIDFNTSSGGFMLRMTIGTTPVNYLAIVATNTGVAPALQTQGDTDVDLSIQTKGAGLVRFGTAGNVVANGAVATTMTSLGPTGSHTTIQEWLQIKNPSGVVRFIPLY